LLPALERKKVIQYLGNNIPGMTRVKSENSTRLSGAHVDTDKCLQVLFKS
jgi:hypothetical protein